MKDIRRGDLYYADLSNGLGSEQSGCRPVLVVQNNRGNRYSPTVIVAALTTKPKKPMPTHVAFRSGEAGLPSDSIVMLEQMQTIDKTRLGRYIGTAGDSKMREVNRAMSVSLNL